MAAGARCSSLRAPQASHGVEQPSLEADKIRAAVARAHQPNALFVDMKAQGRCALHELRSRGHSTFAGWVATIVVLLLIALRSPTRVARTLAPLVAAVLVVSAGFALSGKQLTILHLIGMLLIVAVGSNYALFFNHRDDANPFRRKRWCRSSSLTCDGGGLRPARAVQCTDA